MRHKTLIYSTWGQRAAVTAAVVPKVGTSSRKLRASYRVLRAHSKSAQIEIHTYNATQTRTDTKSVTLCAFHIMRKRSSFWVFSCEITYEIHEFGRYHPFIHADCLWTVYERCMYEECMLEFSRYMQTCLCCRARKPNRIPFCPYT